MNDDDLLKLAQNIDRVKAADNKRRREVAGLCTCGNPSNRVLTVNPPLCGDCRKRLN